MSFQDLEVGRSRRGGIANGKQDPTHEVALRIFEISTAVSTFQRLVNTLATPKDTSELREKLHKSRLHIEQLVKDTSAKLKQANETDHHAEVSASKKVTDAKLAKDFQAVLKEFQKVQRLAAERETAYSPFVLQAVPPSSYTESEIDERSDKHPEQRALVVESKRYQGLSPENLPLSNGRRSHWRTCKEDDGIIGNKEIDDESDATKTVPNGGSGSGDMLLQWGHRKRSRISRSVENRSVGTPIGGSGLADDSSSSSSTQLQAMMKVPRRSITLPTPGTNTAGFIETKNSSITNIMPPPSSILPDKILITASAPTNSSTSNGKVGSHKSSSKDNSSFVNRRNLEDRSGGGNGSHLPRSSSSSKGVIAAAVSSSRSKLVKRSPQKTMDKNDQKKTASHTTISAAPAAVCSSGSASLRSDEKINGLVHQEQVVGFGMTHQQNNIGAGIPQEAGCSNIPNNHEDIIGSTKIVAGAVVATNGVREVHEWPRVHIPLSRKEKEEDFLLMKGTKLPHRPKKRPKAVDRMLQYCFPGTWLADVTKARYEVKEKKCTTKKPKRRGLKGMESMESDSE